MPSQFNLFQMLPLIMGGWLALISHSTPAQAQIQNSSVLLAQQLVETLPPPPIPFGQQPSAQLLPAEPLQSDESESFFQPSEPVQSNESEPNFQPFQSQEFSQYNQNFEGYLVYVDGSDFQTLQEIRQIEPSAFVRQYQGRAVIQSGFFDTVSNAQQRVSELQSRGIYGARIISSTNGQEINRGNRGNSTRQASRYYVAIPTSSGQLPRIAAQIRQNLARNRRYLGQYGKVLERTQPRGPHIAVGPFSKRSQAEDWNKYLLNAGYGNARVYYGK